jgi:type 1 glutamine amidotransferase
MTTRRGLLVASGLALLSVVTSAAPPMAPPASTAQRGTGGLPSAERRVNALVVSGGCCHDYPTQDAILIDIVRRSLPVDWTIVYQGGTARESKIPLYANPRWIDGFDIVVHNECFGFVDDPTYIRTITEAHRRTGTPAVVTHCSMHSYRNASIDDWREFVGVTSRRHTAAHAIAVGWSAPGDPLVQGLQPRWTTPTDELYVIEKVWPNTKPLATAVSPEAGTPVFPVVWTNTFHGARVFGTTLGHQATWDDPVFQDLLARGFAWALNGSR